MAIFIQKTDVAEEIQRLESHCQAISHALLNRAQRSAIRFSQSRIAS